VLTARLADLGAGALLETVEMLKNGTATRTPQDHDAHTYAPMLSKALSPVDWNKSAREICDQIRGLIPWPCAACEVAGRQFKLFRAKAGEAASAVPGTVLSADKNGLVVACGKGESLVILELQEAGGKRLAVADYLRGHPINI